MNTFLKVLIIVVVLFIAIKLSPILFGLALVGLMAAALIGAVGLSLVAGIGAVIIAVVAALAPIWIPVLLIMGLISLFKKLNGSSQPPMMAA